MKKIQYRAIKLSLVLSFSVIFTGLVNQAQASWLDQGADLLKNLQDKSSSSSKESSSSTGLPSNLSTDEIQKAFKQALTQGSEAVVSKLGTLDGFNTDSKIHIPLPDSLKTVQSTLDKVGMGKYMDDLETKLNRAAELATPQAKTLFINAIQDMKFDDVKKIYEGPKDSATQYLKSKTEPELKAKMTPIVENSLNEVGAVQAYDKAIAKYKSLPFVPDVKADLLDQVLDKGMSGMFYYIAQEEAAIRDDPVKQSTELLKKVFGQ
ncbi:DUF4197 domain-containing protein [Thiomicrorhabdus hydrogeniphila]